MTRFAVAIDDQNGRRPLRVEPRPQPLELVGLFAHVNSDRDEAFGDEVDYAWIGVHLGIQPSTTGSHGGGREVEQDMPALRRGILDGRFEIVAPRNFLVLSHRVLHQRSEASRRPRLRISVKAGQAMSTVKIAFVLLLRSAIVNQAASVEMRL